LDDKVSAIYLAVRKLRQRKGLSEVSLGRLLQTSPELRSVLGGVAVAEAVQILERHVLALGESREAQAVANALAIGSSADLDLEARRRELGRSLHLGTERIEQLENVGFEQLAYSLTRPAGKAGSQPRLALASLPGGVLFKGQLNIDLHMELRVTEGQGACQIATVFDNRGPQMGALVVTFQDGERYNRHLAVLLGTTLYQESLFTYEWNSTSDALGIGLAFAEGAVPKNVDARVISKDTATSTSRRLLLNEARITRGPVVDSARFHTYAVTFL
jgi:hypothetical protein